MNKKLRWSCLALAALAALLGHGVLWNSAMSGDAKGRADDERAIKLAGAAYTAAFDKGDVDRLLSYWASDAEYTDESGKSMQGRDAIAAMLRKNQENLKGYKLKLEGTRLRFVTPDVALADGKATLLSPESKEHVTLFATVWVKSDGKWLVRSLRDIRDDDGKEPVTPADHLKGLEPLLGDWVSTDKGTDVQVHCRWALNKCFLLVEFKVKNGDAETTTSQRFGWDPVNQQVRSWYFDSVGGFGESICFESDEGWVSEAGGILPDGRAGAATQSLRFIDEQSFVFRSRNRNLNGQPLADTEIHFARRPGKE
jgi:uncharacterized protein (TIGR02246 family)